MTTTLADYAVLSDGKFSLKIGSDIDRDLSFSLPGDTATGVPGVLQFMLDTVDPDDLKFTVSINGSQQFEAKYSSDVFHTVHEVVGNLKTGANTATFKVQSGSGTLQVGDAVLMFQRHI